MCYTLKLITVTSSFTWSSPLKPFRKCILILKCTSYKRKMWACQINYNHQSNKTESHPNGLYFHYPPILGKMCLGEAVWVITWFVWHTLPSINWEWQAAQCSGLVSGKELLQPCTIKIGPLGLKDEAEPIFCLQMLGVGRNWQTLIKNICKYHLGWGEVGGGGLVSKKW